MDLHHYYKEHKDEINSLIMEIASDLAVGRLVAKHGQPFEAFVEPDDPKDPDSGTHYKEEFQDEFNRFYDEEYERVASLMRIRSYRQNTALFIFDDDHRSFPDKSQRFSSTLESHSLSFAFNRLRLEPD